MLAAGACLRPPAVLVPRGAEAVSLLGDTLWTVPLLASEGPWRVGRLHRARDEATRWPGRFLAALNLAHATAEFGRLREAVHLFGEAARLAPTDARPYLGRGELRLRLREFGEAAADLRLAERLLAGRRITEIDPQPDGTVSLRSPAFLIPFLLGFLHHIRGEWVQAERALARARTQADQPADSARAAFWQAVVARSAGEHADAEAAVAGNRRACRGRRPATPPEAGRCFIQAMVLLSQGDGEGAKGILHYIQRFPDWTQDVVIAAEAELARRQPIASGAIPQ